MLSLYWSYNLVDHHFGLRSTRITESPRMNILLRKRSLLTVLAFLTPFPVFGTSVHSSFTFSSTMLQCLSKAFTRPRSFRLFLQLVEGRPQLGLEQARDHAPKDCPPALLGFLAVLSLESTQLPTSFEPRRAELGLHSSGLDRVESLQQLHSSPPERNNHLAWLTWLFF